MRTHSAELAAIGLTKRYGHATAVDDLTLHIPTGEMVALLGPSGCGKTTTLRMIAGLVEPSAGEVLIGGNRVTRLPVHKRNIGMLFQSYALFPHLTVGQNVAFGLEMRRVGRAETQRRVAEALQLVQLGPFADRLPSAISGGQQQRVALARALVIEPSVLLLDEPLGALDKGLRETMQVELRQLQQRLGITTVIVTHDQEEALTLADRIVIMRAGRIEQVGTPEAIYARPVSRFAAGFIGAANFLRGRPNGQDGIVALEGGLCLAVPNLPRDPARDITISLRPEAISVHPMGPAGPNRLPATIEQIVYRGSLTHLYLRLAGGQSLLVHHQNRMGEPAAPLTPGSQILATWAEESNHVVLDA